MSEVTRVLEQIDAGDSEAAEKLLPLVYEDLRRLADNRMAGERADHTLQATALVHEAYVRLVGPAQDRQWQGRTHFFAAAAEAMRRILVDSARRKRSQKRQGSGHRLELTDIDAQAAAPEQDVLAIHEALEQLEALDPRRATLVKLRYFAGFTVPEAAEALGISRSTAEGDWAFAISWLRVQMAAEWIRDR